MRTALLALLLVTGCAATDPPADGPADGEPADVRTCYDGSYEPLGAGTVTSTAPC